MANLQNEWRAFITRCVLVFPVVCRTSFKLELYCSYVTVSTTFGESGEKHVFSAMIVFMIAYLCQAAKPAGNKKSQDEMGSGRLRI